MKFLHNQQKKIYIYNIKNVQEIHKVVCKYNLTLKNILHEYLIMLKNRIQITTENTQTV